MQLNSGSLPVSHKEHFSRTNQLMLIQIKNMQEPVCRSYVIMPNIQVQLFSLKFPRLGSMMSLLSFQVHKDLDHEIYIDSHIVVLFFISNFPFH
jgi:hypothetical protein